MDEMRAVLFDRYGDPDVLRVGSLPTPTPGPDEVLVRVQAVGVNGADLLNRSGRLGLAARGPFPKTVGIDFVGEFTALGASVSGLRTGERVWGVLGRRAGSMAEYLVVPSRLVAPAPRNLSAEEAVSLVTGGTTAITALRDTAHLTAGERLLVRGAGGGVGSVAVQVGKILGAHVVGLAGASGHDFVRALGADEVADYRTTALADLGTFDVVLDAVGTQQSRLRRLLRPGGRTVAITVDFHRPLRSFATILASSVFGGKRIRFFSGQPETALLAEITGYAERGDLVPVVDTVHPLHRVTDAHRALEAGGVRGKHVVRLS
jgi:NADPH:quinone reductase-like Zn-dependent oxidoreductase